MKFFKKSIYFVAYLHLVGLSLYDATVCKSKNLNKTPYPTLIISLDGFRASNLDDFIKENSNSYFSEFVKSGIKAEFMKPSFPSATFPNHYTLVTGLYPESHGIVGNDIYDPHYQIKVELQRGGIALEERWWNSTEPLWMTAKKQGLKTATMFWVSSDVKNRNGDIWLPYDGSYSFESRINDVVNWISKFNMDLSFLYFNEPDKTGHMFGQNSIEYRNKIREMDELIGTLITKLKALNLYNNINIIIVSDHGMATFKEDNAILLKNYVSEDYIDKNKTIFGIISHIHPKHGHSHDVYNALKNVSNIDVYWKHEIPAEYNFRHNNRIAPIVVVPHEGYRLVDQPPKRSGGGHHGYNNSLESMKTIFMARGPNFKPNKTIKPFENVNVYSLFCKIMHLNCHASNGSLSPFVDVILFPEATGSFSITMRATKTLTLSCVIFSILIHQVYINK